MKNNRTFLAIVLVAFSFSNYGNSQEKADLIKPNVIIFYADDLGWQDVELNDLDEPCAWDTPNI